MAYSLNKPIPLFKDQSQHHHPHSHSRAASADNHPPVSPNVQISANDIREKLGRCGGRPNVKTSGVNDPLNIFENQVIPVGPHILSK